MPSPNPKPEQRWTPIIGKAAPSGSLLGKAVVLDHDVNRPGHVKLYFSEALNRLFASDPAIPKNPAEWGDKHSDYESALVAIYGPLRGEKLRNVKHPMTDAIKRYNHLKAKL